MPYSISSQSWVQGWSACLLRSLGHIVLFPVDRGNHLPLVTADLGSGFSSYPFFFFFHFFSTSSCFCSLVWPLLPWSPVCSFANPKAQRPKEESFIFACIVFFCGEVWVVGGGWVARLSSVQSLSHVQLFATPWTTACQASLSITNSRSPHKPMSTESVMPSNHLILHRPLLLLPSIFPSIRVLSNESALCIRWAKYWNFSYNISPSNEYPELISFGMDWLDLVAVQGTLKSLLQHHSSKASILLHSAFFIV